MNSNRSEAWLTDKLWLCAVASAVFLSLGLTGRSLFTYLRKNAWLPALLIASVITFTPVPTTFSVTCTTERVRLSDFGARHFRWFFHDVQLYTNLDSQPEAFTGSIELSNTDEIVVERISGGPLRLSLSAGGAHAASAGRVFAEDSKFVKNLGHFSLIVAANPEERSKKGENIVLPFSGQVEIGASMSSVVSPSAPHLRQADVLVVGHNLWSKSLFRGSSASLHPGDIVTIESPASQAIGFLVVDERPAVTTSFTQVGMKLRVSRPPSQGYTLETSLMERIKNDSLLQLLWVGTLFIWGLPKLWRENYA